MKRLSAIIWLGVIVGALFLLYMVKYQVQSLKSQIAQSSHDLEAEKEALHVVAAEWAYLNRPERLQALADKYLSTSGVTADQVAEIEAIPFPQKLDASNTSETGLQPASVTVKKNAGEAR